jgi:outer membrane protein
MKRSGWMVGLLLGLGLSAPGRAQAPPAVGSFQGAPLGLGEAIQAALSHAPAATIAHQTRMSAAARVGTARSPWLPQLSLSGSMRGDYSYQLGDGMKGPLAISTFRSSGQLALSQLVYDFGRVGGRLAAAQAGAQASETDEANARAQVTLGAMSSFYAVLQAEALLAVASENQQQQLRRQKQSESFFKIGTKPQIDVLIAQTAVAQARLQVLQAQGNVRVTRTQLLQSLGLPEREWGAWHKRPLEPALPPPHPLEAVLSNADAETVVWFPMRRWIGRCKLGLTFSRCWRGFVRLKRSCGRRGRTICHR